LLEILRGGGLLHLRLQLAGHLVALAVEEIASSSHLHEVLLARDVADARRGADLHVRVEAVLVVARVGIERATAAQVELVANQIQRAPQGRSKRGMMTIGITVATSLITSAWAIVPGKVLFDATKAEMCANADWVIDADTYNIGTGSTGLMVVGSGSEANPGR